MVQCNQAVHYVHTQAAGGHLQALLAHRPPLPGLPQRAALAAALAHLGTNGCASLQVCHAETHIARARVVAGWRLLAASTV